ncbi:molybdenum cofactor biosynthesis protein MoaE [Candidatus Vesicomyidisocius calyptogenae]|uniref:Molybdopterin synthase catalytic subunit n=1 Tax=Vesicomyosocius okutanii subsp. Calyptogena okutanii (strain HA) TaxID=412965 RepID=A5CWD5_VESOH|nr:molybdenum cofactor biosynthesis protein MoaE [Candidatus Vesicomyosocius okutanii]BAF61752.1 molybdenum cofactor biosynthesis protein E [Candidatus Vesicomyosocius okutanii]
MDKIIIQQQDFDLSTEVALIKNTRSDIGAIVSFVGFVRELKDNQIQKMTLEYYPGMTEKTLKYIVNKANKLWHISNTTIIHRVGDLNIKDQIVLVITSSKHRQTAFESCEFIMDFLKTQAPFWKKEHTQNKSTWVEAKSSDKNQKKRWE